MFIILKGILTIVNQSAIKPTHSIRITTRVDLAIRLRMNALISRTINVRKIRFSFLSLCYKYLQHTHSEYQNIKILWQPAT